MCPKQDMGNSDFLLQLSSFVDSHCSSDDYRSDLYLKPPCQSNQYFATHGISHAIELLCATQTKPGDEVGMEAPTHFLAGKIFQDHGLNLKSLPMKNGKMLDVNCLEKMLDDGGEMKPPRMIHAIPLNQNPTASTLPVPDRVKLANLAKR